MLMTNSTATIELPGLLAEIEELIGRHSAIKFAAACGGTRIYMPAHVAHDHWMVGAIGIGAARVLSSHFADRSHGLSLDIPKIPIAIRIAELDRTGASSSEIALQLGIHQRTVHRNRRKLKRTT